MHLTSHDLPSFSEHESYWHVRLEQLDMLSIPPVPQLPFVQPVANAETWSPAPPGSQGYIHVLLLQSSIHVFDTFGSYNFVSPFNMLLSKQLFIIL